MRERLRYRTQFCFIAPGSLLDRYASVSRTHLILPQVENKVYKEFYLRKRREGDFLILDNGAYEMGDSVDFEAMARSIRFYRPHIAALPDYLLQDGEKTFNAAKEFLETVAPEFPGTKWMYIPQSTPGNLQGFKKWMNLGLRHFKDVWIGLPRALATHIAVGPNAWLARVDLVEELTMRGVKTHALGMVNGSIGELDRLAWEGCCSCDSSCAIWRGVHGITLLDPKWDKVGTPVDFDWTGVVDSKGTPWPDSVVKSNMNAILAACGQRQVV